MSETHMYVKEIQTITTIIVINNQDDILKLSLEMLCNSTSNPKEFLVYNFKLCTCVCPHNARTETFVVITLLDLANSTGLNNVVSILSV